MEENYLISIVGRQDYGGEAGEIRLKTLGSYRERAGCRYISYQEYDAEAQLAQTTVLKVEADRCVTLMRGGAGRTRLILEKGRRHLCQYSTGYGDLMVGVFTSSIRSTLGDAGGELEVVYTLDINADLYSLNQIQITVKEAEQNDVETGTTGN